MIGALIGRFIAPFALPLLGVAAAAVPVAYVTGRIQGVQVERTRTNVAVLRAEIATLKRDRDIAREAAADAAARAAAIEAANTADTAIVEEVRRAPSNPSCIATDAAARRVQSIGQGRPRRQP